MIESIMIFALGVLAAGLCALLVLPALHGRAERLARRRVEAQFPMSIAELTAEKDHLRAEFAVVQRRLERRVDQALAGKQADMDELGRRAVKVEMLGLDLEARDVSIAGLETDLAETRNALARAEGLIVEHESALAAAGATLAALEAAHRGLLDDLGAHRSAREALTDTHASLRDALGQATLREAALQAEHARLQQLHGDALADGDVRRIALSDLETRLVTQTSRGDELERRLAASAGAVGRAPEGALQDRIVAENAELRRMIADVADRVLEARPRADAGHA